MAARRVKANFGDTWLQGFRVFTIGHVSLEALAQPEWCKMRAMW